jgi:hypothetical protein
MADPFTITALLVSAATAAGSEAAKEATKDAYRALKDKVVELFGPRSSRALAKLENDGTREEGSIELDKILGNTLEPDEATQIQPLVEEMLRAFKEDPSARQFVHARVGLDIDAGGNALIRNIQGAREIIAKVKAAKDVTIDGLKIDTGRASEKQSARSLVQTARR